MMLMIPASYTWFILIIQFFKTEQSRLERARSEKAAALKLNAALETRCAQLESALRSTKAAVAKARRHTSPGGGSYTSERSILKHHQHRAPLPPPEGAGGVGVTAAAAVEGQEEDEEEDELEEEEEGDDNDDDDGQGIPGGGGGRVGGVQFAPGSVHHFPASPPVYARLRHHQHHHHAGMQQPHQQLGQYKKAHRYEAPDPDSLPQPPPIGIYEGFLWGSAGVAVTLPAQSEPAIPQMIPRSPVSFRIQSYVCINTCDS